MTSMHDETEPSEIAASQATATPHQPAALAQEDEAARLSQALTVIDGIVHSTLDSDEVMGRALAAGAAALGADTAAMSIRDGAGFRVRHVWRWPSETIGRAVDARLETHSMLALETRHPVLVDDTGTDARVVRAHMEKWGIKSVAALPLIVEGRGDAVVYYNYTSRRHRFTEVEKEFAQQLSTALSLAVQNARRYEAERSIAVTLQRALLVLPEHVRGIEFDHCYLSADDDARVGGDFHDVFELDDDHVAVMIGDVAGKGIDAARLTARVKDTIRAHALVGGRTVAEVLQLTNRVIFRSTPPEVFTTVFFGVLDLRADRLTYSNAGHTEGLMAGSDRSILTLGPTGPLLGGFDDMAFPDVSVPFGRGELLFLYTDGLIEAHRRGMRRDGSLYGVERLIAMLGSSDAVSVAAIVEEAIRDVREFSHGNLVDDLALLVLRRA